MVQNYYLVSAVSQHLLVLPQVSTLSAISQHLLSPPQVSPNQAGLISNLSVFPMLIFPVPSFNSMAQDGACHRHVINEAIDTLLVKKMVNCVLKQNVYWNSKKAGLVPNSL